MSKDHSIYLKDILDSAEKIEEFVKGKDYASFVNDEMCLNAVIRKLEIIGEAAKNIPAEVKAKHPNIRWAEMARTRDKLIHAYSGIDNEIVWKILKDDIPELKKGVKLMLEKVG